MLEMPLLKVGGENGDKLLVMLAEQSSSAGAPHRDLQPERG